MTEIESVTIITSRPDEHGIGIRTYSDRLAQALEIGGVKVKKHWYWKKEFKIHSGRKSRETGGGIDVGGVITPYLSRLRRIPEADVTHATFSNFTNRKCNVITLMDLIWRRSKGGYPEAWILNNLYKRRMRDNVVICPTRYVVGEAIGWLNGDLDRVFVTHLAPDPVFSPGLAKLDVGGPTVLTVGDANPRKRTLESVKALEGMGATLIHVGRNWNGTPYGNLCLQEAVKRGVDLLDLGCLSAEGLRDIYRSADVLLYPSTDEGFGLPPLEAAACGLTSVVGSHPVFEEVMGSKTYQCDGKSLQSIRGAVQDALDVPISKRQLVGHAKKFSWEKCARETLVAYKTAVEL